MDLQMKGLCASRFTVGTLISVVVELVALGFVVFTLNISPLHPIRWIFGTLSTIFSWYSLLLALPIGIMAFLNGLFMTHSFLAPSGGRLARLIKKLLKIVVSGVSGIFLTWIFMQFVSGDLGWRKPILYFAGVCFTCWIQWKWERKTGLKIMQNSKYARIKLAVFETIRSSLRESFVPSCTVFFGEGLFLAFQYRKFDPLFSISLLMCSYFLCIFIRSSFLLMQAVFEICLSDFIEFPLAKGPYFNLADALVHSNIPLIQNLAALDFYRISEDHNIRRRKELFALSSIGGHPYAWKQVQDAGSIVLQQFLLDLTSLAELKRRQPKPQENWPNVFEISDKKTLETSKRQLNETLGIRNLLASPQVVHQKPADVSAKSSTGFSFEIPIIKRATQAFHRWCDDNKEAKVNELFLRDAQKVIWICLGLAGVVDHSLAEDRFGVVQDCLGNILKNLFELHRAVENVSAMNLNRVKNDRNYLALRSALKSACFRVSKVLRPYLQHIRGLDVDIAAMTFDFYPENLVH